MKKLSEEKIKKIIDLYKNKNTLEEVAKKLNINVSTVTKYINIKGIMRTTSKAKTGRKIKPFTKEHKEKIGKSNKNKKRTEKTKEKLRLAKLGKFGENANNWQGGKVKISKAIRKCFKYKAWLIAILKRDNYMCKLCKSYSNLHVHHIKHFSIILEENNIKNLTEALFCDELWNIKNGITLCKKCHLKQHKR